MKPTSVLSGLVTPEEAATMLGLHRCTIYRWLARGWLDSVRLPNNTIRVTIESIKKVRSGIQS